MYEAENTFRLKGFQYFCCQNNKDMLMTVGQQWNASAVQNIQLCCHSSALLINLLCFSFSDCDCHLYSYFSRFFHAGLPLFIPNLVLLPKGFICSPAALPNTLSITYASASPTPTSVIHFCFGHQSFQLSRSSQLAAIAVRTPEPSPPDYAIILLCQCSYLPFGQRGIQFHIGH